MFLHFFKIQYPQRGYFVYHIQTVIWNLRHYIVGQDQPFQFFAVGQLIDLGQLGYFVVHQEQVNKVGKGVRDICDLFDSVIGKNQSGEFVKKGEVVKFADLIVTEINALKEIESGTHVFDLCQFVSSEIKLSLIKGVGELM